MTFFGRDVLAAFVFPSRLGASKRLHRTLDWKSGVHPWCSDEVPMFSSILDACEYHANDKQQYV